MGNKKVKRRERVTTKSIGLKNRQHDFFDEHPEFPVSIFIRDMLDEQIFLIDAKFLERPDLKPEIELDGGRIK